MTTALNPAWVAGITGGKGAGTVLTPQPAQAFTVAYGGVTSGAAAYEYPGALAIVSGESVGAQVWKDISAAGGTVLAYLDTVLWTNNGLYHDLLYNSSACGAAVPYWPPGYVVSSPYYLADFRTAADGGGIEQGKLACVLSQMISDNPHIGGFFADDLGSMSWYPGLTWSSFPDQQKWYNGAVALCQTFRTVCDAHGLIFIVNGTWAAGTLAAAGGGYPTLSAAGMSLADGGFVEHHDGQISYWGPYAASTQWASQSSMTKGTAFNVAVMSTSAGQTEFVNSGEFAFVNVQTDYTAIAAPWGSHHATGLPSKVAQL